MQAVAHGGKQRASCVFEARGAYSAAVLITLVHEGERLRCGGHRAHLYCSGGSRRRNRRNRHHYGHVGLLLLREGSF